MLWQDERDYQILFLALFLVLGISTRDWTLRLDLILIVIMTCLITQYLLSVITIYLSSKQKPKKIANQTSTLAYHHVFGSLRSAAITSLSLCLLLRANEPKTMVLAGCLAIASKFILRYQNRHFFNPANFGIIMALIFTNDAWVSPGQWGTDWWYLLLFFGTAGIILKKVGRWDTSAAFLLSYTTLETLRNYWLGWSFDVLQHQLMSGSLLLFAFFMLTDPRSIPNASISRVIWAICIALITFILQHYFYLSTAIFWALFIISPLTIIFDQIWVAPEFNWQSSKLKLAP